MPKETDYWGKPGDPADHECDWCGYGSKAEYAFPVYKKQKQFNGGVVPGQFVYVCEKHKHLGILASRGTREKRAA